jgi:hypothetical protein
MFEAIGESFSAFPWLFISAILFLGAPAGRRLFGLRGAVPAMVALSLMLIAVGLRGLRSFAAGKGVADAAIAFAFGACAVLVLALRVRRARTVVSRSPAGNG